MSNQLDRAIIKLEVHLQYVEAGLVVDTNPEATLFDIFDATGCDLEELITEAQKLFTFDADKVRNAGRQMSNKEAYCCIQ